MTVIASYGVCPALPPGRDDRPRTETLMKKWSKRFFVAALVLALVFVGLGVTGWVLKGRRPDWYPAKVLSPEELTQASHSMQNKLLGFQDWAAGVNADDRTHASGRAPVAT